MHSERKQLPSKPSLLPLQGFKTPIKWATVLHGGAAAATPHPCGRRQESDDRPEPCERELSERSERVSDSTLSFEVLFSPLVVHC